MAAKPGERKLHILQAVAGMLEQPKGEKITTAALAARLELSEAALYRHFASKAQMFEGLIEFIRTDRIRPDQQDHPGREKRREADRSDRGHAAQFRAEE